MRSMAAMAEKQEIGSDETDCKPTIGFSDKDPVYVYHRCDESSIQVFAIAKTTSFVFDVKESEWSISILPGLDRKKQYRFRVPTEVTLYQTGKVHALLKSWKAAFQDRVRCEEFHGFYDLKIHSNSGWSTSDVCQGNLKVLDEDEDTLEDVLIAWRAFILYDILSRVDSSVALRFQLGAHSIKTFCTAGLSNQAGVQKESPVDTPPMDSNITD